MKEIQDILAAYTQHQQEGKQTALATVVHVEGSAYRQPGARMLVSEDGQLTGAISGGCLEGDALRKARLAMTQGQNLLITYDTTDDDDAKIGVGLGCNGIIHILIEPILPHQENNPIYFLQEAIEKRTPAVITTLFSVANRKGPQPGTCFFKNSHSENITNPQTITALVQEEAARALDKGVSQLLNMGEFSAFLQVIHPPISLVICGAGNDVKPLVQMAHLLGWPTTVVDGRANYASPERFPDAARVLVAKPDQVLAQCPADAQTVFLLMTHNYNYDLAMLRQLLPLSFPYIGVLGPKKKLEKLLQELQGEGMDLPEGMLQKVFGPVGLDIGAETSEEIALSIISEIKAVFSRRPGRFLRDRKLPIHTSEEKVSLVSM